MRGYTRTGNKTNIHVFILNSCLLGVWPFGLSIRNEGFPLVSCYSFSFPGCLQIFLKLYYVILSVKPLNPTKLLRTLTKSNLVIDDIYPNLETLFSVSPPSALIYLYCY